MNPGLCIRVFERAEYSWGLGFKGLVRARVRVLACHGRRQGEEGHRRGAEVPRRHSVPQVERSAHPQEPSSRAVDRPESRTQEHRCGFGNRTRNRKSDPQAARGLQEGNCGRAGPQNGARAPETRPREPVRQPLTDHPRGRLEDGAPILRRLRRQHSLPDLVAPHLQAAVSQAHVQMRRHHVPEGVRHETHRQAWRSALLSAVRQHPVAGQSRPSAQSRQEQLPASTKGRLVRSQDRAQESASASELQRVGRSRPPLLQPEEQDVGLHLQAEERPPARRAQLQNSQGAAAGCRWRRQRHHHAGRRPQRREHGSGSCCRCCRRGHGRRHGYAGLDAVCQGDAAGDSQRGWFRRQEISKAYAGRLPHTARLIQQGRCTLLDIDYCS